MFSSSLTLRKPKKRPKSSPAFIRAAQDWRDEWQRARIRTLAAGANAYIDYCSSKRMPPWDSRFHPFDRNSNDGIYFVIKHLLEDKFNAVNWHRKPVQRLLCNVGILGPRFGYVGPHPARWKPHQYHRLPAGSRLASDFAKRNRSVPSSGYTF